MRLHLLSIPDRETRHWWLSSRTMTVGVETDEQHVIRNGAPIVRGFIGQPLMNLVTWMRQQGGFDMREIK